MDREGRRIELRVLGHRYPVRVHGPREEARLLEAARRLEDRVEEIRARTGEGSTQHLAVMAALALSEEVVRLETDLARERADEAAFRRAIRARSETLLDAVEEEISVRSRG